MLRGMFRGMFRSTRLLTKGTLYGYVSEYVSRYVSGYVIGGVKHAPFQDFLTPNWKDPSVCEMDVPPQSQYNDSQKLT